MARSQKLTTKQVKAIPMILNAKTREEGCRAAGISRACFYNWMDQEVFLAEFERQQERLAGVAMDLLVENVRKAVSALVDLLDHEDARLRRLSAKDVIEYYLQHKELADLEARAKAVEQKLETKTARAAMAPACTIIESRYPPGALMPPAVWEAT